MWKDFIFDDSIIFRNVSIFGIVGKVWEVVIMDNYLISGMKNSKY